MQKSVRLSATTLLIPSLNIWPRNWRQFYDNFSLADIDKQYLYEILSYIADNNMPDEKIIQLLKDEQQHFKQRSHFILTTRNKKIKPVDNDDFISIAIICCKTIRTFYDVFIALSKGDIGCFRIV